jgi:gliding motility-associated-like protein
MKEINFEHIDLFLKNELAGKELSDFEQKLKSDPEFAEAVESQKLAQETIKISGRSKLRTQLSEIHQDVIVKKNFWKSRVFRNVAIISVLLVAGVSTVILTNKKTKDKVENIQQTENNSIQNQTANDKTEITTFEDNQETGKINSHEINQSNDSHPLVINENSPAQGNSDNINPIDNIDQDDLSETPEENDLQKTDKKTNSSNKKTLRNSNPTAYFVSDEQKGCAPLTIAFTEKATIDNGEISNFYWDFGDGNSSISPNPTHTYTKAGIYTVTLKVWAKDGSVDEIVKRDYIQSYIVPQAKFKAVPDIVIVNTNIIFDDKSSQLTSETKYSWDFGDGIGSSTEKSPSYVYREIGVFDVYLKLSNEYGCENTTSTKVEVIDEIKVFVPNSFTPDGDGQNDTFKLSATGIKDFYFAISNRKGEMVYQSNDYKTHGWDGKINGRKPDVIPQVFVYVLKVKGLDGREFEKSGTITLLK